MKKWIMNNNLVLKRIAKVGIGVMILMLLLTILFQDERMYLLDPNWMLYIMSNSASIQIQEMRIGSFITHLFPVLGVKLGLDLNAIQFLYNISFFSFFTVIYALIYFKYKQYDLNLFLLAYFTLFVGDVFYWPNNEVHQGIVWAFLSLAMYYNSVASKRLNWFQIVLMLTILFLGISSHLLVVIPVLFVWVYKGMLAVNNSSPSILRRRIYIGVGAIFGAVAIKLFINRNSTYDDAKLAPLKHIEIESVMKAFYTEHAKNFYALLFSWHSIAFITAIIALVLLVKYRNKWYLLWTAVTILGYWILINLIYPYPMPRNLWFYMESEYQVLGIVLVAPIIYLLRDNYIKYLKGYFAVLIIVCFVRIGLSYNYFNGRLDNLKVLVHYCHENNITKAILPLSEEERKAFFIMDWGVPTESLTYSVQHLDKPITIKVINDSELELYSALSTEKNVFISCFGNDSPANMNPKYFYLDTIQTYTIIDAEKVKMQLEKLN